MITAPVTIEGCFVGWDMDVSPDKLWRNIEIVVEEERGEIRHCSSLGGHWTVLAIEDPALAAAFAECFLAMFEGCTIREGVV